VPAEQVESALDELEVDWQEELAAVRARKFGHEPPSDLKEQARQSRFLQQRGFSGEQISRLFRTIE
jgi:regulatory protein